MSLSVKVDLSGYPKGAMVSVGGLPPVENGKTVTISDEDADAFKIRNGKTVRQAFQSSEEVTVSDSGSSSTKEGES